MGWAIQQPNHDVGDVLGGDAAHVFVDGRRALVVALEANVGELRAAAQPRLDVAHAHACSDQIVAQVARKLLHVGFGRAVNVAARIRVRARDRAHVDDVAALAPGHSGQNLAGKVSQAGHVGGDHLQPIVGIGLLGFFQAQGFARVIDQDVHFLQLIRNRIPSGVD